MYARSRTDKNVYNNTFIYYMLMVRLYFFPPRRMQSRLLFLQIVLLRAVSLSVDLYGKKKTK